MCRQGSRVVYIPPRQTIAPTSTITLAMKRYSMLSLPERAHRALSSDALFQGLSAVNNGMPGRPRTQPRHAPERVGTSHSSKFASSRNSRLLQAMSLSRSEASTSRLYSAEPPIFGPTDGLKRLRLPSTPAAQNQISKTDTCHRSSHWPSPSNMPSSTAPSSALASSPPASQTRRLGNRSHDHSFQNPFKDNEDSGVKLVDPVGEVLLSSWEVVSIRNPAVPY
ncbi:hypothetical protein MBM_05683 [Drepanopeziza brunnea f. sp. 'multigermtubi' MB_m1]|uniref:Uncharacterized protein n=1 Tax=Marssonina brunnea f. sp. multigermtubi (strain MB_m1) TaxID=1072389 RepID=K1XUI6_MARBU|nr:uncharacterized protein MBM_05683 [Drepanopeziza brunnea f. sp. 'multigermtubi' MB_m1]EKD16389.1 hypothetical protein MBM_05683 [Drepanopeziza brunnea f. sp. 'multigermtubi' MB_m1]